MSKKISNAGFCGVGDRFGAQLNNWVGSIWAERKFEDQRDSSKDWSMCLACMRPWVWSLVLQASPSVPWGIALPPPQVLPYITEHLSARARGLSVLEVVARLPEHCWVTHLKVYILLLQVLVDIYTKLHMYVHLYLPIYFQGREFRFQTFPNGVLSCSSTPAFFLTISISVSQNWPFCSLDTILRVSYVPGIFFPHMSTD